MRKILIISAFMLFLSSCIAVKLDMTPISLGMTKEQVEEKLGMKAHNIVAAKKYDEGTLEVLLFRNDYEQYLLYFWDGVLDQWEPYDIAILRNMNLGVPDGNASQQQTILAE